MEQVASGSQTSAESDGISIGYYEDWMFDQVIDMMVAQYGRERAQEIQYFRRFFEAPFQKFNGIRLVAVDGERVCGFQSYFYWPYILEGRRLRTFQSGNSLVSADYRGRGIFARLLNHLDEADERPEIDFLIGFPVEMSYGSFIRNGWANPLDLDWWVRPVHPLSVLRSRPPQPGDWRFETRAEAMDAVYPEGQFALCKDVDFQTWRNGCRGPTEQYLYFHHREAGATIRFTLKPNRRGRVNELIIGDIVRESEDPRLLRLGLRALIRAARSHGFLAALSLACSEASMRSALVPALRRSAFLRTRRRIYFIVKPGLSYSRAVDPSAWQLFRSDIDTW